jgi:hypothetical protein
MEEYKTNSIEETIEQIGTPNEEMDIEYDDSFLTDEDKEQLLKVILAETKASPNNKWCDEIMINCLATYKYKQAVNLIDRTEYKREKEKIKSNVLSILES